MTPARPAVRRGGRDTRTVRGAASARGSAVTPHDRSQWRWILPLIVVAAFAVHANGIGNGFIYFDDPESVVDNASIRELGWAAVGHWFTTPLQSMYSPLAYASYAIDHLAGQGAMGVYHFTNVLLHLANVVLVFLVIRRLTGRTFPAGFVAAAFAIHPMNVDTVAWISTRSNLLATLFSLAALLAYLRHLDSRRPGPLVWSVVLFGLATLSKSTAVALPLVLFLIDHFRGRGPSRRSFLEKIPFLAIAVVMGVVALAVRQDVVPPRDYTILDRFFLACSAMVDYLVRVAGPFHLSLAYEYPGRPLPWYVLLSPLVLAAVVAALLLLKSSRRVVVFGLGFFAVTIALTQAVLLIDNYHANRYAYLPYLGLFLIAGHFAEKALQHRDRIPRAAVTGALAVFAVLFATLTITRNMVWKDTETIMSDAIAKEPGVAFAHNSRGIARYTGGDDTGASADFERTIALDKDFMLAYYYLGLIEYKGGDHAAALARFDYVVSRLPTFAPGYSERGRTKIALRDHAGALADLSTAIGYDPGLVEDYYLRGLAEIELGDLRGALADLNTAVASIPGHADAYYRRGVVRSRLGDTAAACADWKTAASLGYSDANRSIAEGHCAG
ncbi:glycosyltransferase family 39 protein [Sphaerisporangium dianthi]|uniref:Glycosyltransferase family 39 protein n=1 Tax=Sphaerisporangium dianthi TaxID=1436120 RepID=A0ABV9CKY7_9ACTN